MSLMFTIAGGILLAAMIPPAIALVFWLLFQGLVLVVRMWPLWLGLAGLALVLRIAA